MLLKENRAVHYKKPLVQDKQLIVLALIDLRTWLHTAIKSEEFKDIFNLDTLNSNN
jgi:hypothetical protein